MPEVLEYYKKPDFQWFKNNKITTVGELIEALKEFPLKTGLYIGGTDCGGYNICFAPFLWAIELESGHILLDHLDYEFSNLKQDNLLTQKEKDELQYETKNDEDINIKWYIRRCKNCPHHDLTYKNRKYTHICNLVRIDTNPEAHTENPDWCPLKRR